ncbi:hypothetical protein Goarm_017510, partial [Gossypium armourianum]|nr:hypothetical protein [Gossypium armourianum]
MKGMLELYEAAHFQLHGETILEELAYAFTIFHLKLTETTMDYPLSTKIANALKQPLHKSLPRWWKDLDVATSFPFIRDGLVECCFWILRAYFKPHYTIARTFMT